MSTTPVNGENAQWIQNEAEVRRERVRNERIAFVFLENSRHSAQRFASNRKRRERTISRLSDQRRAATADRRRQ